MPTFFSPINLLLIEDNFPDFILIKKQLQNLRNPNVIITHADTCESAIALLRENNFDVILSDLSLPDSSDLDTVKKIHNQAPETPIVILTGLEDEEMGMASISYGVQDYLVKGEISSENLRKAIFYSIERKQKLKEILILNQELENYAHVVSHDLKQPLQTILASSRLILHLEPNLQEKSKDLLTFILSAGEKMNQLIDTLLSCDLEEKEVKKIVNCEEIIEEVIKLLREEINHSQAIININIPEQYKPVKVFYHPVQLGRIWQNLISNGIKYVDKNIKPHLEIRLQKQEDKWLFALKDNGIGINPENYHKIFEMKERLSTDKKYEGNGIGLAVCQKIISSNGGKIWVESTINKGSTFFFTIPRLV